MFGFFSKMMNANVAFFQQGTDASAGKNNASACNGFSRTSVHLFFIRHLNSKVRNTMEFENIGLSNVASIIWNCNSRDMDKE